MVDFTHIIDALAEPRRRAIVELLADGERCLCDISAALGVSDQLASHHVKRLRDAGIVRTSRRGQWLHCTLDCDVLGSAGDALHAYARRARARADRPACCSATVAPECTRVAP